MFRSSVALARVAAEVGSEILAALKAQSMSRSYLLAIALFVIAVFFVFLALNPVLYSFVYPLF